MSTQLHAAPPAAVTPDKVDVTGIWSKRNEVMETLRNNPGEWAILSEHRTPGSARTVKTRIRNRMVPAERERWSTAVRSLPDGSAVIWACFDAQTKAPSSEEMVPSGGS